MNALRRWLFGYEIVRTMRYRDISYLPDGSEGIPSTIVYWRNRSGKIVEEIISGWWTVEDLREPR